MIIKVTRKWFTKVDGKWVYLKTEDDLTHHSIGVCNDYWIGYVKLVRQFGTKCTIEFGHVKDDTVFEEGSYIVSITCDSSDKVSRKVYEFNYDK